MRFDRAPMRVELAHASGGNRRDAPARGGPPQRSGFRVRVSGLPPSASWQDLKDHMRKAGDVGFTDVDRRGGGVVEYATAEGMDRALRELHQSDFSNRFGEGSRISVEEERGGGGPPPRGPPPRGPAYDDRGPPPRDGPYDSRGPPPRDAPYDSRGPPPGPRDGPSDSYAGRDGPYDGPSGGADRGAPMRDEDRGMAAAPASDAGAAAPGAAAAADSMPEAAPAAHSEDAGEGPADQPQDGPDGGERDE